MGGITPPFLLMAQIINFTVGAPGAPANNATMYYNPTVAGKKLKLFREGVYQYGSGLNYKIQASGSIVFVPRLITDERITIIIR